MARDRSSQAADKAQQLFKASDQREAAVRAEIEKERAATAAKTAKLKALRLAKEASDRAEVEANPPPPKPKTRRPAKKTAKSKA
ncbi:MAG TPA: hypothetical protein VL286_08305 [Rhizomicrobium sp.]|jgi:hypothetical protein|nr:hypothetical protein [Rhizomicrobium sp.]